MRNVVVAATVLPLSICATLLAQGPPGGGPPNGGGAPQATINSAIVNNSTNILHAAGQNLCATPTVKLNGIAITATNATTTSFDVNVSGVAPGSYLLNASCGAAGTANASFDVTLGAVGPQGPQGPPGPQGIQGPPGSTSAPPVQYVLDRNGVTVGTVVGTAGVSAATIRYPVLGDFVYLQATSGGLSNFGINLQPFSPATVFFKESDCSGDAYFSLNGAPRPTPLLTKRQAMILSGLFFSPPTPPPPGPCPPVAPGNWLYVTDPLACPVSNIGPTGITPLGFVAYYGFPTGPAPNGNCAPLATPEPPGSYLPHHRTDDLAANFTPPFYVP